MTRRKLEAIVAIVIGLVVVAVLSVTMGQAMWSMAFPADGAPNLVFSDGGYNPDTGSFYIDVAYCPDGTRDALNSAETMEAVLAVLDSCSGLVSVDVEFGEWAKYSRGSEYP